MPYYYVYAPYTGQAGGRYCYPGNGCGGNPDCCKGSSSQCSSCGCGSHTAGGGMCCPADIFAAASTPVKLYVNSEIKSVRIDLYTGFCANSPPASYSWVNDAVKVELYCGLNASSTMIGKVMFGHLRNRESYVSEGQIINQPNINGRTLGILGSSFCSCNCYPTSVHGHHTHMGRTSGNSGTTNSWNCWQNVTTGFWVYRWYLSNCAT